MPLMQTTRKPVKVYLSTDPNAPQITATAGSIKTLLKACLVTGYGDKPALGWEMPFEDGNFAAFRSQDPTSTQFYLRIENSAPKIFYPRLYFNMSDINTGEWMSNTYGFPFLANNNQPPWVLVGHEKAFWLFIKSNTTSNYDHSSWLYFGDFPSYAPADTGNCIIAYPEQNNSYLYSAVNSLSKVTENRWIQRVAKTYDGLNKNMGLRINSRCLHYAGVQYPDFITGGLQADAIDLHEYVNNDNPSVLRGRLPGLYATAQILNLPEYTQIDGFDGTDDQFLKVKLKSYDKDGYFLVNITAWEDV